MDDGAKLIFHAFPLTPFDVWPAFLKITEDTSRIPNLLAPMARDISDWRYNLDGFVVHAARSDLSRQSYMQLFRDGGIEAVSGGVLGFDSHHGGFYGLSVERAVVGAMTKAQGVWKLLGVTGPVMLGLCLSGVKGWRMLTFPQSWSNETFDADPAIIPDAVLNDERTPPEWAVKPILDLAWNGAGWPSSPYFSTGEWEGRHR